MNKLPNLEKLHAIFPILSGVSLAAVLFLAYVVNNLNSQIAEITVEFSGIQEKQDQIEKTLPEELYTDHLELIQKQKLEFEVSSLQAELENALSTENATDSTLAEILNSLEDYKNKLSRNRDVALENEKEGLLESWGLMIIDSDFDELTTQVSAEIEYLDKEYNEYLATLPPPAPVGGGYSYTTVTTEKGSTHGVFLIKMPLNEVRVKTVSAINSDCSNNCQTKSLAEYVNENGGFAGMNGSYFCPPDYSECGGKVNSFDYAFYDSNDKKWLNKDALTWFETGMFTFRGGSFDFYKKTSEYGGGSVDAGIANYPSLLKNSEIVVDDGDLTSYQKVKGLRGAIGMGGENLYLALVTNATVKETAYAMKALGAKHALNLDGGGSSAMYVNGQYVVGPGRSLANAIVLIK